MELTLESVADAPISIEQKFDFLYDCAVKVLSKYNPCKITFENTSVHCIGCGHDGNKPNTLCCKGCRFHTNKGCIAEKPLSCKLWLCETAKDKFPECRKELNEIRIPFSKLNLWSFRGDKKASLKSHLKGNKH